MAPERKSRKKRRSRSSSDTLHHNGPRATQLPLPPPFASSSQADGGVPLRLLTIGHSNHDARHMLDLLRLHGVQTLVDVRSAPYSRYAPHFSRDALAVRLGQVGIRYCWAGDTLGGRPADPACYREKIVRPGNVDYDAVARQPWYQVGLRKLLETAACGITAIMCSEEEPRRCHRHRLIERSLRESDVDVLHIRSDGSLEKIEPGANTMPEAPSPQLALMGFGE